MRFLGCYVKATPRKDVSGAQFVELKVYMGIESRAKQLPPCPRAKSVTGTTWVGAWGILAVDPVSSLIK